ncbi:32673_t:CDS:2, partial [Gigaspora margarita]
KIRIKKSRAELDRLINELTRAEEKYLPLIEHGYPVKHVFTQSRQSILQLKENFKTFTQRQFSLTQTILYKRVSAEKEKVATTIENLRKEVANLKNELFKNNKQIALLTERHKKLLDTHESLLKNHTTLKDDYDALLENNSNYYVEHCRLLEQENCVLVNRNLELFEETEELRKEIEILFEEIEKLKKRNESLSCMIDSIWDCFSNKILLVVYTNVDYSQIYVLNPLLELNIGTSREDILAFRVIAVKKGSVAILCEIEVYTSSPELISPRFNDTPQILANNLSHNVDQFPEVRNQNISILIQEML